MHPDDGEPIVANFGRFGPYVKHGDEFRSLESDDEVFTIDARRGASSCCAQPKKSRRRPGGARKTVLRELGRTRRAARRSGCSPGRYGPYVTDGTTNASLPKGSRSRDVDGRRGRGAARCARGGRPVEEAAARRAAGARTARPQTTAARAGARRGSRSESAAWHG